MINTFSAHSLKVLDNSLEEFKNKYILNLDFIEQNEEIILGNKFHRLIYYLLKGYDIEKFENALFEDEIFIWEKIKKSDIINFALQGEEKFIEQPFFIKEDLNGKPFYLTGRFDCVIKNNDKYTILDWKTKNLPKNPEFDLQTLVYFIAASKLFKTENIEMIYYSLVDEKSIVVSYSNNIDKIKKIVSKIIQ